MSKPKTYDEIYEWCLSQPLDITGNQAHAVACYFAGVPASCQYGKGVGMPEYRCAVHCQYQHAAVAATALAVDNALCSVLPGVHYMDPPDGGSVTPLEQVQRMAKDAARYRWLRSHTSVVHWNRLGHYGDVELDAQIDAAKNGSAA